MRKKKMWPVHLCKPEHFSEQQIFFSCRPSAQKHEILVWKRPFVTSWYQTNKVRPTNSHTAVYSILTTKCQKRHRKMQLASFCCFWAISFIFLVGGWGVKETYLFCTAAGMENNWNCKIFLYDRTYGMFSFSVINPISKKVW